MNIKLISPRVTMRPMDSAWKTQMSPPLALLVLGALTPPHHRVSVEDENTGRVNLDDHPDLVGITVKVDTVGRATRIAAGYRARGIPVVMGGIHPTACPEDCLARADAVVVGEAETLWPEILIDAENHRLKKLYRCTEAVAPERIPVPRWELLDERQYLFTNTLSIGRGCPWRCDFCYNSSEHVDARYRHKTVEQVLAEIESLGEDHIMFIDDNFIGNPTFARRLIPELARLGVTWNTAVSADIGRHPDLLDMMADAGCKSLFIGFESVNPESLRCCHKVQNRLEHYDATVAAIHARKMMVNASVVFGFDEDGPEVFPSTLEWLTRNRVATMTAHILTPYPGTRLHRQLEQQGRIVDRDLSHYNTAHAVFQPARMTGQDLEEGYRWIYKRFYSWPCIWQRMPREASQVAAYLQFAFIYRKFGKVTCKLSKLFGMRPLARLARRIAYRRRKGNGHGCGFGRAVGEVFKGAHATPRNVAGGFVKV